ncbi:EamA family transporter [Roseomonas sp. NAR14]|uniref:EamA family transporter n=1 Tax=Roseomonas acroporae TaxID=2937791 RepID=A0A9X1Y9E6_9PROT|nr:EamA family transporter [Roseomonas acroporae]MCK8785901.1 EamA family transporter [Roseomonas acroporae]
MMPFWLALAAAIFTSVFGQVLLKVGATGTVADLDAGPLGSFMAQILRWETVVGMCLYGGAALLYIVALRRIPMSVALPCTAASYVVVTLIGYFVFGETVGARQVGAIALICCGVLLLATA